MPRAAVAATGLPIIDATVTAVVAGDDLEGTGVPSGVLGTYVGQRYWNLTGAAGARLYYCTVIGTTWVAATGV